MIDQGRNLDHLQARCAMLERVLRVLDPTIDIEARISEGVSPISGFTSSLKSAEANSESGLEDEDEEETVPESACDFEWHEGPRTDITDDITSLADGMAFLNVDSRDVGYLGMSPNAPDITRSTNQTRALGGQARHPVQPCYALFKVFFLATITTALFYLQGLQLPPPLMFVSLRSSWPRWPHRVY